MCICWFYYISLNIVYLLRSSSFAHVSHVVQSIRCLDCSVHRPVFERSTGKYCFLFSKTFALGRKVPQPPVKWIPPLFLGVKRAERVADYSAPSSDDVKNEWHVGCTPAMIVRDVGRNKLTFTFTFNFDQAEIFKLPPALLWRSGSINWLTGRLRRQLTNRPTK